MEKTAGVNVHDRLTSSRRAAPTSAACAGTTVTQRGPFEFISSLNKITFVVPPSLLDGGGGAEWTCTVSDRRITKNKTSRCRATRRFSSLRYYFPPPPAEERCFARKCVLSGRSRKKARLISFPSLSRDIPGALLRKVWLSADVPPRRGQRRP